MSVGSAAHHRRLRPSAPASDLVAPRRRRGGVDLEAVPLEDDAVVLAGAGARYELVLHVTRDPGGIALERIAPAARSRRAVTEHVTAFHRHRELAGKLPVLGVGVHHVLGRLAGAAAIEPVRPEVVTVRANLQHGLSLEHLVVAPDRGAAAVLAGAADVLDELGAKHAQRLLRLGDLDR